LNSSVYISVKNLCVIQGLILKFAVTFYGQVLAIEN